MNKLTVCSGMRYAQPPASLSPPAEWAPRLIIRAVVRSATFASGFRKFLPQIPLASSRQFPTARRVFSSLPRQATSTGSHLRSSTQFKGCLFLHQQFPIPKTAFSVRRFRHCRGLEADAVDITVNVDRPLGTSSDESYPVVVWFYVRTHSLFQVTWKLIKADIYQGWIFRNRRRVGVR